MDFLLFTGTLCDEANVSYDFFSNISQDLTFTNSSSVKTHFNQNGVLEYTTINEPRFEYDPATGEPLGLLLEDQSKNYILYSDFSRTGAGYWIENASAILDQGYTLLGLDAAKLTMTSSGGSGTYQYRTVAVIDKKYTQSIFVKRLSGAENVRFGSDNPAWGDGTQPAFIDINLATGVVLNASAGVESYKVESLGDNTYRLQITGTLKEATAAFVLLNNATGGEIIISGAQFEQMPFATSYIPTLGSEVTRASDFLFSTNVSWYNPNQGTFIIDAINRSVDIGFPWPVALTEGEEETFAIGMYQSPTTRTATNIWRSSTGAANAEYSTGTHELNKHFKQAHSYSLERSSGALNGVAQGEDTTILGVTNADRIRFSRATAGAGMFAMHLKSFKYWNKALIDDYLEKATS